jgi:hypothetical protein
MQDADDANSAGGCPVKDYVLPLLVSMKPSADRIAGSPDSWVFGEKLKAGF